MLVFILLVLSACSAIPLPPKLNNYLDSVLDLYMENPVDVDKSSIEEMQGDQPAEPIQNAQLTIKDEFNRKMREKAKIEMLKAVKSHVLDKIRRNTTVVSIDPSENPTFNSYLSEALNVLKSNVNRSESNLATVKTRSLYPSCQLPKNTDFELWQEENWLNLYFDLDNIEGNLASATLRLYRANVTGQPREENNCETTQPVDVKYYRVTAYYYLKTLKRHRAKTKIIDTKMMSEYSDWVELNILQAAKVWSKGKNFGLGIQVEDQERNNFKTDSLLRGAVCTPGASTPKPIPTILLDQARGSHSRGLRQRFEKLTLPTLDLRTVEMPESLSKSPCVKDITTQSSEISMPRHIRHQRQHTSPDPRANFQQHKIILTNEELSNYNLNSTVKR